MQEERSLRYICTPSKPFQMTRRVHAKFWETKQDWETNKQKSTNLLRNEAFVDFGRHKNI